MVSFATWVSQKGGGELTKPAVVLSYTHGKLGEHTTGGWASPRRLARWASRTYLDDDGGRTGKTSLMITHGRRSFLSRVSGCSYNLPTTGPLVLQPVSSPWVMTSFFLSLAPPLSSPPPLFPFFFPSPKEESGRFSRIGLELLSGLTGPVLFFPAWNAWTGPVEDTEKKDAVGTRDRFVAIDVPVCVRAMAGRDFPCRAASCPPAACQISLQIHTTFCRRFF